MTISFLDAASAIGRTLCDQAHWDRQGRFCNWMGRSPAELSRDGSTITPTSAALGPGLYGGSAGVALFLAQLFALTDDPAFRRTALGAIARSLRQVELLPEADTPPLSFFNGHLGLAFASDRVSTLTGQEGPGAGLDLLLDRVARATKEPHLLDLIGGSAGAIPALLMMGRVRGHQDGLRLATELGQELCGNGDRGGTGWRWDSRTASGPDFGSTPLTGLSHGAAGIGLALIELHAATGRIDFLEAALGAFRYEDSLFDPRQDNWPDLRFSDSSAAPSSSSAHAMMAWCHGAPGIALTRLRAAMLDPPRRESHTLTARTALASTARAIEKALTLPRYDATLCHGLSGLAEVVLIAGRILGEESYLGLAASTARSLVDRHAGEGDWPSGVPSGGPNPSLMIGTAGVGYTFLRLHDPALVPPVLLLMP